MHDTTIAIPRSGSRLRPALAILLVVVLAGLFWTQSRYPSLDEKQMMSGSIQLEDPLSFEVLLPVDPTDPVWKRITFTTINWVKTNRNGMTFGVLFGAAFLTFLRYLPRKSFKGRFSNSLLGMAIGAPLGVCVNCAAPIAKGIYQAGARAETTLAAMMASPTMNIVVLTMLFSVVPFYLAITKIALSVFMVIIVTPVIVRLLPAEQLVHANFDQAAACEVPLAETSTDETPFSATVGFATDYLKDLWFIVSRTVPLMLLAGFLGAVVATLIPLESLSELPVNVLTLLLVSVVGVFLPVPIAFDVVVAGTLLNGGLPIAFVMPLLFSLGIFSVYSFLIISNTISLRAAALVTVAVIALSVLAGFGAQAYYDWRANQSIEYLLSD